jgi:hypothetical protein
MSGFIRHGIFVKDGVQVVLDRRLEYPGPGDGPALVRVITHPDGSTSEKLLQRGTGSDFLEVLGAETRRLKQEGFHQKPAQSSDPYYDFRWENRCPACRSVRCDC